MKPLLTVLLLGGMAFGQEKPSNFEAEINARASRISRQINYVAAQMDNRNKQLAEFRAMTYELVRLQDPQTARIMQPHLRRILKLLVAQGKITDPESVPTEGNKLLDSTIGRVDYCPSGGAR